MESQSGSIAKHARERSSIQNLLESVTTANHGKKSGINQEYLSMKMAEEKRTMINALIVH